MRVMLLGDSILYGVGRLRGYGAYVREYFERHGLGEVLLPDENCNDTRMTRSLWRELIGADAATLREVDAVHWNNGLWDVWHFMGNANPTVRLDRYVENLGAIAASLRAACPRARILFATTTPVVDSGRRSDSYRLNSEILAYNEAATATLAPLGVEIHDLAAVAAALPPSARADEVHYTDEGSAVLSRAVLGALGVLS